MSTALAKSKLFIISPVTFSKIMNKKIKTKLAKKLEEKKFISLIALYYFKILHKFLV